MKETESERDARILKEIKEKPHRAVLYCLYEQVSVSIRDTVRKIAKKENPARYKRFIEPLIKSEKQSMKYFLSRDSDSHWYIVQADKRQEWDKWRTIAEQNPPDPEGWETPRYARRIDNPSSIEFFFESEDPL